MPSHAESPIPFLSAADAAREIGLSVNAVYALCESGLLACHRFGLRGGRIKIARTDLDAYIASCRQSPPVILHAPQRRKKAASANTPLQSVLKARGWDGRSRVTS